MNTSTVKGTFQIPLNCLINFKSGNYGSNLSGWQPMFLDINNESINNWWPFEVLSCQPLYIVKPLSTWVFMNEIRWLLPNALHYRMISANFICILIRTEDSALCTGNASADLFMLGRSWSVSTAANTRYSSNRKTFSNFITT